MQTKNNIQTSPNLPGVFAKPFAYLPAKIHSQLLVVFLNRILSTSLKAGDLDFLRNKKLIIEVRDAYIRYSVSVANGRLMTMPLDNSSDLMIRANMYDFLMLAARKEDPDTLVFQRRLVMQGDTELGLELKNFLDGLDMESAGLFPVIESLLNKSLPLYRRLFA